MMKASYAGVRIGRFQRHHPGILIDTSLASAHDPLISLGKPALTVTAWTCWSVKMPFFNNFLQKQKKGKRKK